MTYSTALNARKAVRICHTCELRRMKRAIDVIIATIGFSKT